MMRVIRKTIRPLTRAKARARKMIKNLPTVTPVVRVAMTVKLKTSPTPRLMAKVRRARMTLMPITNPRMPKATAKGKTGSTSPS
ncbi:hypothetical protein D3C80_1561600 [compost metagenome]